MADAPSVWRNRILGAGTAAPSELVANPRNWRTHPAAQQRALAAVLDEVGWVQNVIVNKRSGFVVDGHARVALAVENGEPSIPVVWVDLSEAEEALVLASLDPLAGMATADAGKLAELLQAAVIPDGQLAATLQRLSGAARGGQTSPDAVPPVPEEPYVRAGELWALGDHRILCGDATAEADVARLLGGERPYLMVTDPPYGVGYDPGWRETDGLGAGARAGRVLNDDRADWSAAWVLSPANVAYCWAPSLYAREHVGALEGAGFELRYEIIWSKPHFTITRGHYHWRHEPCWYGVRRGQSARWVGGRKASTVWRIGAEPTYDELLTLVRTAAEQSTVWELALDERDEGGGHATQKPVECMERPIRNHLGDVYEPFAGSGTTLIAAERQGRRCFAMELDPRWVQVTIERWQNYTGRRAELLESAARPSNLSDRA